MSHPFAVGDTIELTYRGEVVRMPAGEKQSVTITNPGRIHVSDLDGAVVRVVKRRKVKVGDKITGNELRSRMWKRGTVIRDQGDGLYILTAGGQWCGSEDTVGMFFGFGDFSNSEQLTVEYLPS